MTTFAQRPGVVSASGDTDSIRIAFSRQAELVDLAALTLELRQTPGLSNVHQVVVAP